jgi:hypothetical protein
MDFQGLHIITLMHLFLRIAMAHSYSKAITLSRFLIVLDLHSSLYCISAIYIIKSIRNTSLYKNARILCKYAVISKPDKKYLHNQPCTIQVQKNKSHFNSPYLVKLLVMLPLLE